MFTMPVATARRSVAPRMSPAWASGSLAPVASLSQTVAYPSCSIRRTAGRTSAHGARLRTPRNVPIRPSCPRAVAPSAQLITVNVARRQPGRGRSCRSVVERVGAVGLAQPRPVLHGIVGVQLEPDVGAAVVDPPARREGLDDEVAGALGPAVRVVA